MSTHNKLDKICVVIVAAPDGSVHERGVPWDHNDRG